MKSKKSEKEIKTSTVCQRWAMDAKSSEFQEMAGGTIVRVRLRRKGECGEKSTAIIDYLKGGEKRRAVFGHDNFGLWGRAERP